MEQKASAFLVERLVEGILAEFYAINYIFLLNSSETHARIAILYYYCCFWHW